MHKILFVVIITLIFSCKNDEINESAFKLKEKELELRERELILKEKEINKINILDENKKTLSELFKINSASIFLIFTNTDYYSSQGSGFFIREDGVGVSNFHVLNNANESIIQTNDGKQYMITEILNYDEEKDFVVFKISNTENITFKPVEFASNHPEIGEDCFAIGNPQGLEQTLSKGIISGYRKEYIQTTAQITHGSSGGALFNKEGKAIGITTMGLSEADLNFALNVVDLNFLESINVRETPSDLISNEHVNNEAINVIENYFVALSNNDFTTLENIFALKLSRFYNEFNFSRQKAIAEHRNYSKTYPNPKSKINYSSIKMKRDYDGATLVNLNLDFTIKKKNWKHSRTYTYDMFIKLDNNNKINSVFTNIIDSK